MEPYIRSDQYNFIKNQTQTLVNGHLSVNDRAVLNALKSLSIEKVLNLFPNITDEQKQLLQPIIEVKDKNDAEQFLSKVKSYVIPFKVITEQSIKKIFPKAKKLKLPNLDDLDLTELSYLGWDDIATNKKFIITYQNNKAVGLQGSFQSIYKKGICTICNKHEELGLFLTEKKGTVQGTYTKRGNYICQDSQKCNHNITTLDKLNEFISLVNK
jgi:hypothetical protein